MKEVYQVWTIGYDGARHGAEVVGVSASCSLASGYTGLPSRPLSLEERIFKGITQPAIELGGGAGAYRVPPKYVWVGGNKNACLEDCPNRGDYLNNLHPDLDATHCIYCGTPLKNGVHPADQGWVFGKINWAAMTQPPSALHHNAPRLAVFDGEPLHESSDFGYFNDCVYVVIKIENPEFLWAKVTLPRLDDLGDLDRRCGIIAAEEFRNDCPGSRWQETQYLLLLYKYATVLIEMGKIKQGPLGGYHYSERIEYWWDGEMIRSRVKK